MAPTVDNWQDFFLGTNDEIADVVIGMMNPRPRLLLADPTPGTIVMTPTAPPQKPQITPAVETAAPIDRSNAIDVSLIADEELDHIPF
jgi:hypothetical protein